MKRIFAALLILSLLLPALGEGDLKPGDSVLFGRYEQDGISENGPEPIEWVVISVSSAAIWSIGRLKPVTAQIPTTLKMMPFQAAMRSLNCCGTASILRLI